MCYNEKKTMKELVNLGIIVAAYGRVSTKHDDQLNSLRTQIQYYENYCNDKNDMSLHKVYHDTLSATKWEKRKGLIELLYDAGLDIKEDEDDGARYLKLSKREPIFTRILIKDVSRFTRNIDDNRIFKLLRDKGVFVDFTNMNLSTENMSEDMMIQMMTVFSQRESQDRSEKTLFGLERSAENNRIRTRDNFYGYKYIKEAEVLIDGKIVTTNALEIIEEEAIVVRLIYDLYIKRLGLIAIRKYLTDNNIYRNGKPFSRTTIGRILKNPAYKGTLIRNKTDSPLVFSNRKSATLKAEESWKIFEDRIPAIVDKATWDTAWKIRTEKTNHKSMVGRKVGNGKFSGLVKCDKCGSPYNQNVETRTKVVFLNCKKKKNEGVKSCDARNIKVEWVDEALENFIGDGLEAVIGNFKENYTSELSNLKKELFKKIDKQQQGEADSIKVRLEELTEKKNRLGKLFVMGSFNENDLNEMLVELDEEYDSLNLKYHHATLSNDEILKEIEDIENTIKELKSFKIKKHATPENVLGMISSIYVKDFKGSGDSDSFTNGVVFDFEFKIFERLNEIVAKYKFDGKVYTFNRVSIFRPL